MVTNINHFFQYLQNSISNKELITLSPINKINSTTDGSYSETAIITINDFDEQFFDNLNPLIFKYYEKVVKLPSCSYCNRPTKLHITEMGWSILITELNQNAPIKPDEDVWGYTLITLTDQAIHIYTVFPQL